MQQVPWASQLSWVGARNLFPIGTATDSAAAAVAKADVKSDDVVNGGDAASDAAHDCNAVGGSSAVAVPPDVGGVSVVSHCRPLKLYDRPDAAYHSTACAEYSCTSSTSTAEPESLCSPPQELDSGGTVTLQVERYNHNNIVIVPQKRAWVHTAAHRCLLHHVGRRRHSHSD